MSRYQLPAIDQVELVMLSIGMRSIISRKVEKVTKGRIREIAHIAKDIEDQVRAMVRGEDMECPDMTHDYRGTLADLARGWDIQQMQDQLDQFPDDMAVTASAVMVRAQGIIQTMLKEYPTSSYRTVAGSTQLVPSDTKMFRFVSVLEVLDNPMCVIPLMSQGALMQSQVKAMRMVYPSLSEAIDAAIFLCVSRAKAESRSFELPARAEYGVRAWFGRPPAEPESIAKAQDVAKKSTAKEQARVQAQSQPPSRKQAAQSPDSTALQRTDASLG